MPGATVRLERITRRIRPPDSWGLVNFPLDAYISTSYMLTCRYVHALISTVVPYPAPRFRM